MLIHSVGQLITESRPTNIKLEATSLEHRAHTSGNGRFLVQDDQNLFRICNRAAIHSSDNSACD